MLFLLVDNAMTPNTSAVTTIAAPRFVGVGASWKRWARHAIRTAAVLPGDATSDDDVAQLVAYLASPAGDYFSGCAFTLGAAAG